MKRLQNYCYLIIFIAAIGCLPSHRAYKANEQIIDTTATTAKVIANPQYDKPSAVTRILLGEHYRKEWATPVEVEVLNLNTVAGGLTPIREGGGRQTKSLRLRGADGKEYVLRSVNKDPTRAMPPEFVGTFAQTIVQDQISSSNPYVPVAIAELAQAAGIYHTKPKVVFVPNSDRLGEFRNNFANTLCLFEERSSGVQRTNPAYDYADEIVNSERMLSKVFSDNDHMMDQHAFLKVRLFDTWLGDWDRHEDQYVWAAFKKDGKTIYRPIPRDRDQAVPRLDGIIPKSASRRWAIRKTKNFEEHIRDVVGLNMVGVYLDRNFTPSLDLNDWLAITDNLQKSLTDEKIEAAFRTMLPNIYTISAEKIITKLKSRRDELKKHATIYYNFLSREVDIPGTDARELFVVDRWNDDSVSVNVFKVSNNNIKRHSIFSRTFYKAETKEIRLYGLGSNDEFQLNGNGKGIMVRLLGGEGNDTYNATALNNSSQKKNRIYDSEDNNFQIGAAAKKITRADTSVINYRRRGFIHDYIGPKLAPGYNPDDGVYLGGGIVIIKQKFGKTPFGYMQSIWANHSFTTNAYNFWYEGIFAQAIGKWNLHLNLDVNAPNYVFNYFGQGNETVLPSMNRNFNRVRADQITFSPGLGRIVKSSQWVLQGRYQSVEVEKTAGRFVSDPNAKIDSTSFLKQHFGGIQLNHHFDNTNNILYPTRGVKINTAVGFTQNLKNNDKSFPYLSFDLAGFIPMHPFTLALRGGIASNFNDNYEFYQSNTLGGTTNLRGFRRTRFAGKTSLYENTELRLRFGNIDWYILRGQVGVLGFADGGRVWIPDEDSNKWHWGYGGGIWFLPFNKLAFTITYGISEEDNILNIRAGFLF